jgi:hypothetical protein
MGTFRVEVQAVGGHGCQREKKSGEVVEGCGAPSCPDCITREYVSKLKASGASVESALLVHWPQSGTIVDNLLDRKRVGSFG